MTKSNLLIFMLFAAFGYCYSSVYLEEKFLDNSWKDNWIYSEHPGKEFGKFELSAGKIYNDAESDKGIQTTEDYRFYAASRKFPPFSNENKSLVIQFSVQHEQDIDCGGGYVKLFDGSLNQKDMHGDSLYEIMFGPDICGVETKKVHVIFSYKGKNLLINKNIRCEHDIYTHFYTLIVNPDNTYEVLIDNEKVESGNLEDDWDFLPPKKIKDPKAKKPEDWDDIPTIADPNDKKPEDWDKPEHIPDPDPTKPEDWDDEMDGDWEPPMVNNPEYKGEWRQKQIENPNYQGEWKHPEIDNPEYTPDSNLYLRKELHTIGIDVWQVKAGTIFDNILITDNIGLASKIASGVKKTQEGEKKMKEAQYEEQNKMEEEERKKKDDEEQIKMDGEEDEVDESNEHDEL